MNRLFLLLFGAVTLVAHAQVPDYVPTDGLVAWYPFNGNANDESESQNHGVVQGALPAADRNGNTSSAYEFSGAEWIEMAHHPNQTFSVSDCYSISCWFQVDSNHQIGPIISKWVNGFEPYPFAIRVGENITSSRYIGGIPQDLTTVQKTIIDRSLVNETDFYNYTSVFTSDTIYSYLNGELIASAPNQMMTSGDVSNELPIFVGRRGPGLPGLPANRWFKGRIDDIGIWNRCLSQTEIFELYASTELIPGCTDPEACNYSAIANWDDDSCQYPLIQGDCDAGSAACADGTYWNSLIQQCLPISCPTCPGDVDEDYAVGVSDLLFILSAFGADCPETGCTDSQATNYNPNVVINDGSCVYPPCLDAQEPGAACDDGNPNTFNTFWNEDGCLCEGSEYVAEDGSGSCEGVGIFPYQGHEYQLVEIGEQCWFAENLRATEYSNGDSIQGELTNDEWGIATEGAQMIYNNDNTNLVIYGRLYNWYAASDPRSVCPSGWRVPSDEDLTLLTDYLGGTAISGDALKANVFGDLGDENSNSSGFGMLAGGNRSLVGHMSELGSHGYVWSTTGLLDQANARGRAFLSTSEEVGAGYSNRRTGFSIRCLKISTDSCFDPDGDGVCPEDEISGCTDQTACNYNTEATHDDGSCIPTQEDGSSCDDSDNNTFNDTWDTETCTCAGTPFIAEDGSGPCEGVGTVTYQSHEYQLVEIGNQCWFGENLRATDYSNGDSIPANLSENEWAANSSYGAVAVYNEDTLNLENYGLLYNWYAVADARGLCPSGWNVPTDEELLILEMALGMSESEANSTGWRGTDQGNQMKTTYGWAGGGNGTNSSGFSSLPGGYRTINGYYYSAVDDGYWWSSSPDGSNAWCRYLSDDFGRISRLTGHQSGGFSIRCLRDAE